MFRAAHKWIVVVIPLLLVSLAPTARASQPAKYGKAIKSFERFAEARIVEDPIPGISIGFMHGNFSWAQGFGFSDLENQVKAKALSAYRLASVTKPMTAIGVLKLMEDGKLDLDAEVQTYVPYFPRKSSPVTVRLLLGHLGGISHYRNYDLEGHFKDHKNTREAIAVFEEFDLVAEPGTQFQYSSYGYNLLGAVIEGGSGQAYGDYMREVLWGPLGMEDTRMDDPDAVIPNRVRGYRPGPDGEVINSEFVDISSRFAAGGTRSTVLDLLKFAKGLSAGQLLSAETKDLMWTSMTTLDGRFTDYGMGWSVQPVNGRFVVRHSGGQAETRTYLMVLPAQDFAIAVACNYEGGGYWPYIDQLYALVMQERFLPDVYTGDVADARVYEAMSEVFDSGMSWFDRYGKPANDSPAELARAFSYLNDCATHAALEADFDSATQRIQEGRHPVAGSAFEIAGSWMAATLATEMSSKRFDDLHERGAIEFFDAYAKFCRSNPDVPAAQRLGTTTEELAQAWRHDWDRTWSSYTQQLLFDSSMDVQRVAQRLAEMFEGARVYPDYVAALGDVAVSRFETGDVTGAIETAEAAMEIYPRSDQPCVHAGIGYLAAGNSERARALIMRGYALDPTGAASAGGLNRFAYELRWGGQLALGLELLAIARDLHPDVANLYDSTGEFHLEAGRVDEAIAWYERALEVDPNFESAQRMLEKIRSDAQGVTER
jgi:CubicO group peptidase (beta-lactamase class C family)